MIVYRGSLKSCNYHCSYCPFSKRRSTQKELEKDKEQWLFFLRHFEMNARTDRKHALLLAPYGEALIHPWYWEGLARISALSWVDAVGAQTNLGFQTEEALAMFLRHGGELSRLRLWATFHPQMTTRKQFVLKCRQLVSAGVRLSVGAVADPDAMRQLQLLFKELPASVYLWMNRMDGMERPYTTEEIREFSKIDPYFYRELMEHPANVSECRTRIFAQGDGKLRRCSIGSVIKKEEDIFCTRKRCSCYLAYGGRENLVNQMLFGPWPLFRIPRRPKAVFLDIEGTLPTVRPASEGKSVLDTDAARDVQAALEVLTQKEGSVLFFATTLPYEDARKRCRNLWHLFSGGVFSGGAHMVWRPQRGEGAKEFFYLLLHDELISYLKPLEKKFRFRLLVYRNKAGRIYKVTLLRARRSHWNRDEAECVMRCLPKEQQSRVRFFTEESCMQIVSVHAKKAAGVRMICGWLNLSLKEIFAAGDSSEDAEMAALAAEDGEQCYHQI